MDLKEFVNLTYNQIIFREAITNKPLHIAKSDLKTLKNKIVENLNLLDSKLDKKMFLHYLSETLRQDKIMEIERQKKKYNGMFPINDSQLFIDLYNWLESYDLNKSYSPKAETKKATPPKAEPTTFEELFFNAKDIELTFKVMRELEIINDGNKFIYGDRTGAIACIIDVLKIRNKIDLQNCKYIKAVNLLASKVNTKVTKSTAYGAKKTNYGKDLIKDLKSLIN